MKANLYNLCYKKRNDIVIVQYKSPSGRLSKIVGTMLLPVENFVEIRVNMYVPNNGTYILQILEDRIIDIDGIKP